MRHSFGRPYLYQKPYMAFLQGLVDSIGYVFLKPSGRRSEDVKKILVSRIDHLGDVFLASSVLPHLKKAYPQARIDFMAASWSCVCLKDNPYIDRVIVYDAFKHNRRPGVFKNLSVAIFGFLKAVREIRKDPYDLCLMLRAYPFNGIVLAYLGGCKNIAGFSTGGFGFLLDAVAPYREGVHESAHLADALNAVGVKVSEKDLKPSFSVSKAASSKWASMKKGLGVSDNVPYILIHTGAGNPKKYWKKEGWQTLINSMAANLGYKVFVYDPVCGDLNGCIKIDSLIPFDVFAAALKGATAFAGLDSLPAHLAASFGISTVVVWCGINDPVKWRPVGERVAIVKKDLSCAPCSLKDGCAGMACMDINAWECFERMKGLLRSTDFKGSGS
ncbi:MAG: glycosyltransferase family 9 protein [Deltaproteobacteria bacterium]|nr:glycosyltransferase family 9 protein [Deltaproteobacteria bacterium]